MLGFGLSEKPRNITYSIMMQADLQEALLEHLGVSEAHILAHDYGDTVAQELLARHNDGALSFSIKSMVLLNGGLFPEQHRARPIQKLGLTPIGFILGLIMTRARLRQTFDKIFGPETKAPDEELDAHWSLINENGGARILHKLLRYIPERRKYRRRWVGALQDASTPIRLIDGGADPVSGAHMYEHFKSLVPNADAVLLEKIGHYPQTEAPVAVARAFIEFHRELRTITA
jgi:pimeloyl-ACP methyl ester carboxylesterase